MMQSPLKRMILGGAGLLIMLAPGWSAVYYGSCTIRPAQPTGIWSRELQPMDTANLSIKVIKQEGRYQLKSGPTSHPATGQYSVWNLTGTSENSSSKTFNYTVLNTSPQESSTQVRVTCVWEPLTGPGGGGGGTRPDDIPGYATGTAHMAIGQISWDLSPNQRHAGPSGPIAYTVRVVNEHNNLINTNTFAFSLSSMNVAPASAWQIWPSSGPGPSLSGNVTSESGSVGYLRLQYNYFGHLKTSISPRLTFVSIENMQYQKDGAWINVPDMIYSCLGSNLNFRVTPRPSFAAWPPFKPVWSGATGSGGTASATHVLPGVYNVTAECGNTVNAQVTIIKVEIENTAPRDTHDIQVQHFTNSAGVFTYTAIPLQVYYRLQPDSGWTPDSVELRIKNPAGSTVRTIALPTSVGQQQKSWDGKDNSGDYVANGSNYLVEIAATGGGTTCTATNGLTVYEIRQGNCVYRPITINEHAAILYEYLGENQLADIQNDNNYTVMEHPGTGGTTGPSNYGNFNNWIGAFCPPSLSRTQRKAILEKAHELDNANIPYVTVWELLTALVHNDAAGSPAGNDWAGTVGDILRIRCDGTVEVAYEDVDERLYGDKAWWNIMNPGAGAGSNLRLHNDSSNSMNPQRQRAGINAAHDLTRNREDAIYLP